MSTPIPEYQAIPLQRNEKLEQRIVPIESMGNFSMIGRLRMSYTKSKEKDLLELLCDLSKGARDLFIELKQRNNYYTNLACYPNNFKTQSEKNSFSRSLSELKKKGLIKKAKTIDLREPIGPHTYMHNPKYLKCPGNQEAVEAMWRLL